ncbi:MAG: hypothetical protein II059_04285 [Clostridia bacterium]|nr:hypothetical protein [Clostridia bacterium]
MSNFQGYLLKFGSEVFPNKYLDFDNQASTPNQRAEAEAYVDANNELHRITLPKYRTKIEYNTIDNLSLADKIAIQNVLSKGLIDSVQRKYLVTYWNDETNSYETSNFYIPDTTFQIKKITSDNIIYRSFKLTLIEY